MYPNCDDMIKFDQVTKSYNNVTALKDITLEIHKGEFLSLVGQSGAGKSTLMSLIIGEERPDSGRILIDYFHLLPYSSPK